MTGPAPRAKIGAGNRAERRIQKACKHPPASQWINIEGRGYDYCALCGYKRPTKEKADDQ